MKSELDKIEEEFDRKFSYDDEYGCFDPITGEQNCNDEIKSFYRSQILKIIEGIPSKEKDSLYQTRHENDEKFIRNTSTEVNNYFAGYNEAMDLINQYKKKVLR
jgi:hypothetical protein